MEQGGQANGALAIGNIIALVVTVILCDFGRAHLGCIPTHLFGRNHLAFSIYVLLVLPGTLFHELSHALTAMLLNVKILAFSVRPTRYDDNILLGYVAHGPVGIVGRALIGIAPLTLGLLALLALATAVFDAYAAQERLAAGDWVGMLLVVVAAFGSWRGWLAAYAIFIISASMMPSTMDLDGWWPLAIVFALLILAGFLTTPGAMVLAWLAEPLGVALRLFLVTLGLTMVIDCVLVLILAALHQAVDKQFPFRV